MGSSFGLVPEIDRLYEHDPTAGLTADSIATVD
jgi:hypothetical protein